MTCFTFKKTFSISVSALALMAGAACLSASVDPAVARGLKSNFRAPTIKIPRTSRRVTRAVRARVGKVGTRIRKARSGGRRGNRRVGSTSRFGIDTSRLGNRIKVRRAPSVTRTKTTSKTRAAARLNGGTAKPPRPRRPTINTNRISNTKVKTSKSRVRANTTNKRVRKAVKTPKITDSAKSAIAKAIKGDNGTPRVDEGARTPFKGKGGTSRKPFKATIVTKKVEQFKADPVLIKATIKTQAIQKVAPLTDGGKNNSKPHKTDNEKEVINNLEVWYDEPTTTVFLAQQPDEPTGTVYLAQQPNPGLNVTVPATASQTINSTNTLITNSNEDAKPHGVTAPTDERIRQAVTTPNISEVAKDAIAKHLQGGRELREVTGNGYVPLKAKSGGTLDTTPKRNASSKTTNQVATAAFSNTAVNALVQAPTAASGKDLTASVGLSRDVTSKLDTIRESAGSLKEQQSGIQSVWAQGQENAQSQLDAINGSASENPLDIVNSITNGNEKTQKDQGMHDTNSPDAWSGLMGQGWGSSGANTANHNNMGGSGANVALGIISQGQSQGPPSGSKDGIGSNVMIGGVGMKTNYDSNGRATETVIHVRTSNKDVYHTITHTNSEPLTLENANPHHEETPVVGPVGTPDTSKPNCISGYDCGGGSSSLDTERQASRNRAIAAVLTREWTGQPAPNQGGNADGWMSNPTMVNIMKHRYGSGSSMPDHCKTAHCIGKVPLTNSRHTVSEILSWRPQTAPQ